MLNASVDGNDIVYHEYYDIGVAVSDRPRPDRADRARCRHQELRGASRRDCATTPGRRAKGSLAIEDLTGGTFTITNGGVFGSLMSTPIVNAPQSAILACTRSRTARWW